MTGYLAALAARELPPAAAAGATAPPWAVTPRRVAPYEASVTPPVADVETTPMLPSRASAEEAGVEPGEGERHWGRERAAGEPVQPAPAAPPGAPAPRRLDEPPPRPALVFHGREAGLHRGGTLAPAASTGTVPPSSASPVEQPSRFDPPVRTPRETAAAPSSVRESVLPAESRAIAQLRVQPAPRTPAPVMPRPSPVQAERTERPHHPTPREITPPVVVTIGRIEVRAIPTPPPARAMRDTQPAMSLDDYLRERTRGLR